ncbi:FtsW/RodA/SpoVE family cell cycle protein [Clostridium sp. Marseille-P299]|uniref:FtsW/RodA/SpoVE family cell cycle protein n=1 Tax=Clostridium sp. Marseille-P299 TaxID=1805477 RepID=UPI00325B2057
MTREEMEQGKRRKGRKYYDYSLLFLIIFLVCFGLVMIYSTSSYNAAKYYDDPSLFLRKQGMFVIAGIPLMIVISKIDYHFYISKLPIIKMRPVILLYFICLALQAIVLVVGDVTQGSQRWINVAGITFQPSELTKVCVVLFAAYVVQLAPKRLDNFIGFMRVVVFVGPLLALVVAENFSTALIILSIMVAICFVASRKKAYFFVSGGIFAVLGAILVFGVSYRSQRIDVWRDVENHPYGYQILQGLYAIASGGLFGKGLGNSMQKLGFIPEAHNDMIFSVICEELGMFGAIAVIILFLLVIWRLFVIAINAPDLYGGLIATGVLAHIAVQVLINIAVVTNSIPSTGIPLPFISYGGSSLMVLLIEMGIVLSVSNQIQHER